LKLIVTLLTICTRMTHRLDRDLLFLLGDVGRLVRTHADRRAREGGMTRAQWVILGRLERQDGLTQKELAAVLEVEPITVGRLVDRLQARGLVERRADPRDRRVWRLHLTQAAGPVLRELAAYRAALHEEITAGLAPQEVERVVEALLRMKANLLTGVRIPEEAA
jgi:DNA-binding MarR family transcriptional regulator